MLPTATQPDKPGSPANPTATTSPLGRLFQTQKTELVPGTSKYWIRILLAPICLLMVAGLHWYRVEFRDQSQWKGGGFAMFSTVDAPTARSLRCYLLTDHGEIAVEPPIRLEKWVSEMRVAPHRETMQIIASRMEEATWVRSGYQWRSTERELAVQQEYMPDDHDPLNQASVSALGLGEPVPPASEVVAIQGVRLELWRYSFDRGNATLNNRKAMEYTHLIEGK